MTRLPLVAATLVALPLSTILVGCDRRAEDTAEQKRIEQSALERDLALALRPDSAATRVQLRDLPAQSDTPAAQLPALVPPPAAQLRPEVEAPPPPARVERKLRPVPPPADERDPAPIAAQPAPEPTPEYVTRTAVAGQSVSVSFDRQVSARQDGVGSTFTATLTEGLVDELGRTVIPAGSTVTGRITSVERGRMGLEFTSLSYAGERISIDATLVQAPPMRRVNEDSRGERVAKVAAPAAGGAVVGRVVGGRRGAVIGAIIGGVAGAAHANASADIDTVIDPGATATIRLDGPVSVRRRVN